MPYEYLYEYVRLNQHKICKIELTCKKNLNTYHYSTTKKSLAENKI